MPINLMEPVFTEEMLQAAINALKNEFFLKGKSVNEFETQFAEYIGVKHAIAVNSGTTALHLSLLSMGIGKGDYVITTPATFIATANAIMYTGAKPLFVDISLDNYTLDPIKVKNALSKEKDRVKAIIPVHLYGYPANMDEINEIAEDYGIRVLEDACQAHGGSYKNRKLGSLGDAAAFSFYPSKNMTVAGDGGIVTTNDDEIAEKIRMLRDCGRSKESGNLHLEIGYTARMNTVNAAIGKVQLKNLDYWVKKRTSIVEKYFESLSNIPEVILPPKNTKDSKSAWHLFVIRTKRRDELRQFLGDFGIRCGVHYPIPVHLQPPYRNIGYNEGMFPNAEIWAKEVLSIPLHVQLTEEEIAIIVEKIYEFYRRNKL